MTKAWDVAVELGSEVGLRDVRNWGKCVVQVRRIDLEVTKDDSRRGEISCHSRKSWPSTCLTLCIWLRRETLFSDLCRAPILADIYLLLPLPGMLCPFCDHWKNLPHIFTCLIFPPRRNMKKDYRYVGCLFVGNLNSVTIFLRSDGIHFPVSSIIERSSLPPDQALLVVRHCWIFSLYHSWLLWGSLSIVKYLGSFVFHIEASDLRLPSKNKLDLFLLQNTNLCIWQV